MVERRAARAGRRVDDEEFPPLRAAVAVPEAVARHPARTNGVVDHQLLRVPRQQLLGARVVGAGHLRAHHSRREHDERRARDARDERSESHAEDCVARRKEWG